MSDLAVDKVISIPSKSLLEFFVRWFEFLAPIHKLGYREIKTAASVYKLKYELSEVILDDSILDSLLLKGDYRKSIMQETGLTSASFNVSISQLKKAGIIRNKLINKSFMPIISPSGDRFRVMLNFEIDRKGSSGVTSPGGDSE